mgnify:CR=1 FL=1
MDHNFIMKPISKVLFTNLESLPVNVNINTERIALFAIIDEVST